MATAPGPLPPPSTPWVDKPGTPSLSFRQYFLGFDAVVRGLWGFFAAATFAKTTPPTAPGSLIAAVDDDAARIAGVPVGGFYRSPTAGAPPNTTSNVRIRVT